jgi:hypothetical protein
VEHKNAVIITCAGAELSLCIDELDDFTGNKAQQAEIEVLKARAAR